MGKMYVHLQHIECVYLCVCVCLCMLHAWVSVCVYVACMEVWVVAISDWGQHMQAICIVECIVIVLLSCAQE
jgi:hypothetical protein